MKRQHIDRLVNNSLDERNYDFEAKTMIKPLGTNQLYELYEIAVNSLKKTVSEVREKELNAVISAIENHSPRKLDEFRLAKLKSGYRSEMASKANPKHGNSRKSPKKVG